MYATSRSDAAAMVSCAPFAAAVTNSGADSRALADRCLAAVDEAEGAAASVQVPAASCSSKPAAHPYLMGVRYVAQIGRDGDEAAATDAAGEAFAKSLGTTLRFLASRVDNFGCGSSNTELKLLALAAAFVMLGEARGSGYVDGLQDPLDAALAAVPRSTVASAVRVMLSPAYAKAAARQPRMG
mgnify:CR=1 FL=1